MKRSVSFLVGLMVCFSVLGQVPRDTSYTLQSAYFKIKKKYPEVSLPEVVLSPRVQREKDVTYHELNGRSLTANLFYPIQTTEVRPGIVIIHGGGWRTGDKSMMSSMAERLAQEGFVVLVPEYRLSLESPYPAAVLDLKVAIQWFRSRAGSIGLDQNKIAVLGCSAGGQLAALIGTTNGAKEFESTSSDYSSGVQAIIDIDGVLKFRHPDSKEGSMAAQWLGGTYEERTINWEEASPLNHVSKDTPPTLFIASKYPRFLAGHQEFIERLSSLGIAVGKRDMDDAPHSFWLLNPWFEPTIDYVVNFINETL